MKDKTPKYNYLLGIIVLLLVCIALEGWYIYDLKHPKDDTNINFYGPTPQFDLGILNDGKVNSPKVMVNNRIYQLSANAVPLSTGVPRNATLYGEFIKVESVEPTKNLEFTAIYDATGSIYYFPNDDSCVYVSLVVDDGKTLVYPFRLIGEDNSSATVEYE